jgi:inner membrane protein
MAILIVLLSFLFLNKKVLMVFLPLFFISLFILPTKNISYLEIVFSLFIGLFSHIVLDSFTPTGIKIFAPISSKKVHANFGKASIFILIVLAIAYNASFLFSLFENYVY